MPEAHVENGLTCQVILGAPSGLARDAIVNTFHFNKIPGGRPSDGDLATVAGLLSEFYTTVVPSSDAALGVYFSRRVARPEGSCAIKIYRLDDTPPRTPTVFPLTMTPIAAGGEDGLPPEVAMCLSYKAASKPGPRGRGRVFIGPLRNIVVFGSTTGHYHPTNAFQQTLVDVGARLRDHSGTANLPWQVYSTRDTAQHMHTVTQVWVDDEFDTQRRRGDRPTSRIIG